MENYGSTTDGLTSRLTMLQSQLTYQRSAVQQYERMLQQANTRLKESYDRHADYSGRLEEARRKHEELGQAIQDQEKYLEQIADLAGKDCDAYRAETEELNRLKEEYAANGEEVKKLSDQCDALQKATQKAADAIVSEWTEKWKTLTSGTRDELTSLQQTAKEAGHTGVAEQLQKDIDSLDDMDGEMVGFLLRQDSLYLHACGR